MRETVIREPMVADTARSRATPPDSTQKHRSRCMLNIGVYNYFEDFEAYLLVVRCI